MSKILFIDVDGTLVDYENHLPESAVRAIRAARAAGHRVYICTGRSKAEVYPPLREIGLDGMIGGNGSYVEDHGKVVMHPLITPGQARRIVDWLHSRKLEFYLESNNGLFASEHFETAAQDAIQEYSRRKGRPGAGQMTVRQVFPDMIFGHEGAQLYRDDLNKVSYLLGSYQDFLDTKAQFPDMQNGTWGGGRGTPLCGGNRGPGLTEGQASAPPRGEQGHHQGKRHCPPAGVPGRGREGHHRLWGRQGGHPHAGILRLWRGHGQRRRRDQSHGRPGHRRGGRGRPV